MIEDFSEEEKEILTAEAVEQLAAKHAELAIEDFGPYLDLSPLQEEGSLWAVSYTHLDVYKRQ